MSSCSGYGAATQGADLEWMHFERRALRPDDVSIKIDYCGVCHSDLHEVHNDWKNTLYPCIPGHEIVGRVTAVGGIPDTQKLLDCCAQNNVLPVCEAIRMQDINTAYRRMRANDVKYRFVIDMSSLATTSG